MNIAIYYVPGSARVIHQCLSPEKAPTVHDVMRPIMSYIANGAGPRELLAERMRKMMSWEDQQDADKVNMVWRYIDTTIAVVGTMIQNHPSDEYTQNYRPIPEYVPCGYANFALVYAPRDIFLLGNMAVEMAAQLSSTVSRGRLYRAAYLAILKEIGLTESHLRAIVDSCLHDTQLEPPVEGGALVAWKMVYGQVYDDLGDMRQTMVDNQWGVVNVEVDSDDYLFTFEQHSGEGA